MLLRLRLMISFINRLLFTLWWISVFGANRVAYVFKSYLERFGPFYVLDSHTFVVNGPLGHRVTKQLEALLSKYPDVKHVIMDKCSGSENDQELFKAGIKLQAHSVHIHLSSNSVIVSGGVDFFLAGATRSMDKGAKLGVHAWDSDNSYCATDLASDHPEHEEYIDYYSKIGYSREQAEELYWFIINSAEPSSLHFLTENELIKYQIIKPL